MEGPQLLAPLSPGQDERHAPSVPILDVCLGFPETISEAECRLVGLVGRRNWAGLGVNLEGPREGGEWSLVQAGGRDGHWGSRRGGDPCAGLGGVGAGNQGEVGRVCHQSPHCAGGWALV